jgi:hypothetical protein
MPVRDSIMPGDHIEVTPLDKHLGGPLDFGVIRGVALTQLQLGGPAGFEVQFTLYADQRDPLKVRLNSNEVNVRLLFSARVARGL